MRSVNGMPLSKTDNTWMPGSWEPGRIHLVDALTIKVVLIVTATIRGLDYMSPAVRIGPAAEQMQVSFPLVVWGLMLVIPATILAFGLASRTHFAVWLGHGLLAIVYLCLMVAMGAEFVTRPWWDGIRSASGLLTPVALHALICARTGWRPPAWPREKG